MSPEKQAAYDELVRAAEAFGKFCPWPEPPKEPPNIRPRLLHANTNNFYADGLNMFLDAGGYMPGKVPVVVVPIRPEDVRKYKNKRTAVFLLRYLGELYTMLP